MAEEPQPTALQEGASNPHAPTSTAEDRKAAAALSSLDTQDEDAAGGKKGKDVDTRALNEAMAKVSVEESKGETKKQIKVQPKSTDVALLVKELEVPKEKATELLKRHNADAVKAMAAFVTGLSDLD